MKGRSKFVRNRLGVIQKVRSLRRKGGVKSEQGEGGS